MEQQRPTGVIIIVILGLLGAIGSILGGATIALIGSVGSAILPMMTEFAGLFMAFGIIMVVIGILSLIGFIWLYQMKKKGFMLVVILEIIGVVIAALTFNIMSVLSIAIAIIIVAYLFSRRKLFQ